MTLRIAVTRTQPEADASVARLREAGAEAFAAPLLSVEPASFDRSLAGAAAVLFTSANGVRAFGAAPGAMAALCVGEATARSAREAGFSPVDSAQGDARALAGLAARKARPEAGKLVHISGGAVAFDLVGALQAMGFSAERRIAYRAEPARTLPEALRAALAADALDRILFHSARAVEAFAALAGRPPARLQAVTISANVAEAARAAGFQAVIAAAAPREDALITAALAQ